MTREQLSPNLVSAIDLERRHLQLSKKKPTLKRTTARLVIERQQNDVRESLTTFERLVIDGLRLGQEILKLRAESSTNNSGVANYRVRFDEHIDKVRALGHETFEDYQDVRIMLLPETLEFFEEQELATVHEFPAKQRAAQIAAQKALRQSTGASLIN